MSFMSMGVKKNKVSTLFQVVDVDDGTVRWINADLVSHIVPRVWTYGRLSLLKCVSGAHPWSKSFITDIFESWSMRTPASRIVVARRKRCSPMASSRSLPLLFLPSPLQQLPLVSLLWSKRWGQRLTSRETRTQRLLCRNAFFLDHLECRDRADGHPGSDSVYGISLGGGKTSGETFLFVCPFLCLIEPSCRLGCWRSSLTTAGTPWVIMLRDWPWAGRVMRTVPGGQALLGLFLKMLTAATAPAAHRWWWLLLGLFAPGNTFNSLGGDRDTVPFLCLEGAFWACATRHRFDAHPKSSSAVLFRLQLEVLPLRIKRSGTVCCLLAILVGITLSSIVAIFCLGMANHWLEFKLLWTYWFLFDLGLLFCFPGLKYVREMFFNAYITNSMAEV